MNTKESLKFSGEIILITSLIASRIKYLLHSKPHSTRIPVLLDVLSHFTLIPTILDNQVSYQNLLDFHEKISIYPYSELDELKGSIKTILAKIEAHKDSFH
ncbi:hypothetical protein [Mannheimia pernigra]|uniref:hypothetical protein n=1 Tax=Mannheimia pernigra TaxID=111844 RepID=UPI00131632F9|nr:hypothetical protein [Mannheimia pernigra]QHB18050.1 hypothetical protein GM695_08425 [Mannheimia pernigra]